MIQRVQSVYLFFTAILMAVTVCSPLLTINDGEMILQTSGVFDTSAANIYPTWGIITITLLAALLALVDIFLYKKRTTQIKVSYIISFLIVLFYATVAVYYSTGSGNLDITSVSINYGLILPLIAFIFNILACIKIKADEKLVRSLNRIR